MSRIHHACALFPLLVPVLLATDPASGLEKRSVRADAYDRPSGWNATDTATLRYYNDCTGWVWVWSGWESGESMGVCFDPGSPVFLNTTWMLIFSGVPCGYGFTGTISIHDGCDCSAPVVASHAWCEPTTPGWTAESWGGLPVQGPYFMEVTFAAATGFTNGTGLASDHPAAGATGPQACGTCYPSDRVVHSRYFGVGGAYCPSGIALNDGVCDVEFLIESNVKIVTGTDTDSWGRVKSLYR